MWSLLGRLGSNVATVIKRRNVGMHRRSGKQHGDQMSERQDAPLPWQWLGPDVATATAHSDV